MTHSKYTFGSLVYLERHDGQVALVKHGLRHRLRWGLPGGFGRRRESEVETAVRELKEETSVELDNNQLILLGRYVQTWAAQVDTLYYAQFPVDQELRASNRVEVRAASFFDLDAADRPKLTPETVLALEYIELLKEMGRQGR